MNIYYKVIELSSNNHNLVVRYWTDKLTEEILASNRNRKSDGTPLRCKTDVALDIPIPVPTAEQMDQIIRYRAPYQWLEREENKLDFSNSDENYEHLNVLIDDLKTTTLDEVLDYNVQNGSNINITQNREVWRQKWEEKSRIYYSNLTRPANTSNQSSGT
jgi:hypothetical protein